MVTLFFGPMEQMRLFSIILENNQVFSTLCDFVLKKIGRSTFMNVVGLKNSFAVSSGFFDTEIFSENKFEWKLLLNVCFFSSNGKRGFESYGILLGIFGTVNFLNSAFLELQFRHFVYFTHLVFWNLSGRRLVYDPGLF